MRPRWSPAISQGMQQHGGSNRHNDRPENAAKASPRGTVEADPAAPDEPRGVNPALSQ
jgi:hypothetical protein